MRVADRVYSRTEDVVVASGELAFEPATRRVRGASTSELFGDRGTRSSGGEATGGVSEGGKYIFIVTGQGYLVASPGSGCFTTVVLDDDILYLRESLIYAFESRLRWESGHVPGSDQKIHVVQFRGQGCVALRSRRALLSVKLAQGRVIYVERRVLAGWIGRVIPRVVAPAAGGTSSTPFVECSGEGVVLVEDRAGA